MPRRESPLKSSFRRGSVREMDDPLSVVTAPPEGETQEEAEIRIRKERDSIKISDDIDRELRLEMQTARRQKCLKILLLGQSESGKSTVLKNFQRKYDPSAFDRERAAWRSVCQLNVVRSFGIILDLLNHVFDLQDRPQQFSPLTPPTSPSNDPDAGVNNLDHLHAHGTTLLQRRPELTADHRKLVMRLAPLRQIEHALTRRFKASPISPASPPHSPLAQSRSYQELHVNGYAWQRARSHRQDAVRQAKDLEEDEGLCSVLCACRDDMVALWGDPAVRNLLRVERVGMEELSSFFLDNLARIAVPDYSPTDDDILRARLKTLGVTEHHFTLDRKLSNKESTADFRIYDVGGSRNQRARWMPFFDDVNAIIFLAPMSAFDQTLIEAPDVNRLEDTFVLWKNICSSKLLVKVSFVLLLNKRDVLQRKLESGIRFGRYVKSYAGENQWEPVAKYLKSKFRAVQRELSPVSRLFYSHITCATDTQQMAVILAAIEDFVLRRNLQEINLL